MSWIDLLAIYWFSLKILLYVAGVIILVSGFDDLFIDVCYWSNLLWRKLRKRPGTHRSAEQLDSIPQQHIAIMVPAWQEASVIGKMAELAAKRFDYQHFEIFVGTYPNDEATQKVVDEVALNYKNIHKVVCANPGPTTKADCVNNIILNILRFEKQHDIEFACFVFHDAEDVVHAQELKLFNYWCREFDLVQIPVFPLPRPLHWLTSGHYNDEFAEFHSKDMLVRQLLSGNVPSAGVGTGFSRRAIVSLAKENHGQVFNTGSLTEDYDVSIHLHKAGFKQIYVQQQLPVKHWWVREHVAIREYFPHIFSHAVRQKSRWIVGIVFQGWRNLGWNVALPMRYILYRDRKAMITNPVNVIAYFIVLNIVSMSSIHFFWENAISFPALIYEDSWLMGLIYINGILLLNRFLQRFIFVSRIFGFAQGLVSIPRMAWGNVINFLAFIRALKQFSGASMAAKEVKWDKTSHEFPELDELS